MSSIGARQVAQTGSLRHNTYFHSRNCQAMELAEVLSDRDSDDDFDEEECLVGGRPPRMQRVVRLALWAIMIVFPALGAPPPSPPAAKSTWMETNSGDMTVPVRCTRSPLRTLPGSDHDFGRYWPLSQEI